MNDLQIFESEEFGEVHTITEGDKTLFCGSDVAKALLDTVKWHTQSPATL